ncbi:hypothetical protein [Desulfovibrio subterraneus]|uniref:Uncharacterized protein n=1 Tax=Desulfovibrio subterraneus TaxID=2718620 RepID=A0A7J0BH38_9BACT|nr:hypothetical protein [Desulfovibrio subterraneus]GFM33006.1 hypothetical protein DSM101010T_13710 [Desulfovibrio subterraneus]
MGGGGGKSYSPPAPVAPPPPDPPKEVEGETVELKKARDNERKAQLAALGRESTIITGALGDTSQANVNKKQLLGQ